MRRLASEMTVTERARTWFESPCMWLAACSPWPWRRGLSSRTPPAAFVSPEPPRRRWPSSCQNTSRPWPSRSRRPTARSFALPPTPGFGPGRSAPCVSDGSTFSGAASRWSRPSPMSAGSWRSVPPRHTPAATSRCHHFRDELGRYLNDRPTDADALVFTAPKGGPLRHNLFYRHKFKPAVAAAGLPERLRFHDLRHSYAAFCTPRPLTPTP